MTESDFPEDLITILKKKLIADKDNPLKEIRRRSDFSEIYLKISWLNMWNLNQKLQF